MAERDPVPRTWPLGRGVVDGRLSFVGGDESIREAIVNILLTRPGERVMRPDFGAGVEGYLHQPNNATNRHLLASVVERAVRRWEPRVEVEAVDVDAVPGHAGEVTLTVRYRTRFDRRAGEIALKFDFRS